MRKLNFAIVSQAFPPHNTSGVPRYNHTLAKEMASRGHNIYVITKSPDGVARRISQDGFTVIQHVPADYLSNETKFADINGRLALVKSVYAEAALLNKQVGLDVILAPLWDAEAYALVRNKVAPLILTLMSPLKKVFETDFPGSGLENEPNALAVYELERECIMRADGIMSISKAVKDTMQDDYGIDWQAVSQHAAVNIVPLGADDNFLNTPRTSDKKSANIVKVLYVNQLTKRKGIDLLLNVIPRILAKVNNVQFDLVGKLQEGHQNYPAEFAQQFGDNKWINKVKFHGYVDDKTLAQMYADCDVFVAPSRYESFGIPFVEAMANAKPVVGTRIGGIPEIIEDGVNGFLFGNENEQELESSLTKLIQDPTLRAAMGKQSFDILKSKFTSELMADNVEKLIAEVLNRQSHD